METEFELEKPLEDGVIHSNAAHQEFILYVYIHYQVAYWPYWICHPSAHKAVDLIFRRKNSVLLVILMEHKYYCTHIYV